MQCGNDFCGIKIGIVAYTYETGSGYGTVSINGSNISDETAAVINSFNFNTLNENLEENETLQASGHISKAKQALEDLNEILGRNSE